MLIAKRVRKAVDITRVRHAVLLLKYWLLEIIAVLDVSNYFLALNGQTYETLAQAREAGAAVIAGEAS